MTQLTELSELIDIRLHALPKGLRDHVARARRVAVELARLHGIDELRADLGVSGHDLARAAKDKVLLNEARRYGIRIHAVERHSPFLLHGRIAAAWLEHEDGITDAEVLEAIRWHTTGRKGMGRVAKVVFLADKLDPYKVKRHPALEKVMALAHEDIDGAIFRYLNNQIDHLLHRGFLIHPASLALRNQLAMNLKVRATPTNFLD